MSEFSFTIRFGESNNPFYKNIINLPAEVTKSLLADKAKRVVGTINGTRFNLGLISDGNGGRYLIIGKDLMKAAGLNQGSVINVVLSKDPNPDSVEVPEELEAVIEQDDEVKETWEKLKPGMKRSLSVYVKGAKSVDVRIKRALEITGKMMRGELNIQNRKKAEE